MRKLLAILGIIGAGALGASISLEQPVKEPIVFNVGLLTAEQETEKSLYGDYVQVTKDGRKLVGNTQVNSNVPNLLPANAEVHVYDGPNGKGYQVIEHTPTSTISTGFGPEAASRTWTKLKETNTASTTP